MFKGRGKKRALFGKYENWRKHNLIYSMSGFPSRL
jgi:hypothetical protein